MKKIILYLSAAILISMLVFAACEKEYNKVVRKKHENGQPKVVVFYDGERAKENMVKLEMYYNNGKQKSLIRFKNGVKHGLTESWHKNGTRWNETKYVDGKKQGKSYTTYSNGQMYYIGEYKDTRRVNKWVMFKKNGDTLQVEIYDEVGRLKKVRKPNK